MRFILTLVLVVVVVVGCNSAQPSSPKTASDKASNTSNNTSDFSDELENVENCFRAATYLLQREPDGPDDWPKFLKKASRAVKIGGDSYDGNFETLSWSDDGKLLQTSKGQTIQCKSVAQEHDHYGPGNGTALLTKYRLSVSGTNESRSFTVEMSIQ